MYNIKLNTEALNIVKAAIGANEGTLDLETGMIKVKSCMSMHGIAKRLKIDNVNNKPYAAYAEAGKHLKTANADMKADAKKGQENGVKADAKSAEKTDAKAKFKAKAKAKAALEERKKIIGDTVGVGSVVRVLFETENPGEAELEHIVIIADKESGYVAARMKLTLEGELFEDEFVLQKGTDIVYRNMTYKDKVKVGCEFTDHLTEENFHKGAGGMIVGKVLNTGVLTKLLEEYEAFLAEETANAEAEDVGTEESVA